MRNPTWHAEDSPWKARQIHRMLQRNDIRPRFVCEVGCGAGEVLAQLRPLMTREVVFRGYEISPQAYELCRKREKPNLAYELKDILAEDNGYFDVVLAIDVFEHVEDYMGFLRRLRGKGRYKIFHVPLDLSVNKVLRSHLLMRARRETGHLHYFNRETALAALEDTGYQILDWFYTPWRIELRESPPGIWAAAMKNFRPGRVIRQVLYRINKDLAVRMLGGFSLMVLAK